MTSMDSFLGLVSCLVSSVAFSLYVRSIIYLGFKTFCIKTTCLLFEYTVPFVLLNRDEGSVVSFKCFKYSESRTVHLI